MNRIAYIYDHVIAGFWPPLGPPFKYIRMNNHVKKRVVYGPKAFHIKVTTRGYTYEALITVKAATWPLRHHYYKRITWKLSRIPQA